jgi:hypothetical protein
MYTVTRYDTIYDIRDIDAGVAVDSVRLDLGTVCDHEDGSVEVMRYFLASLTANNNKYLIRRCYGTRGRYNLSRKKKQNVQSLLDAFVAR